jgi:tetratricopeptide (TPR) repeat protein
VLIDLGRPSEAVESYDRALGIAPDSLETWCNRGAALQALECYNQAIVLKDEFPEAHYNRGCLLMALTHYSDAVPSFRRAVALRPDYFDAHNHLGLALAPAALWRASGGARMRRSGARYAAL